MLYDRKNQFSYESTVLERKDFAGFEDVVNKTVEKTTKIMMSHIRFAMFQKSKPDVMLIKHSMTPYSPYIEIKLANIGDTEAKLNLYPVKLQSFFQKYNDLKKLLIIKWYLAIVLWLSFKYLLKISSEV